MFVYASGIGDSINMLKLWASFPHLSPSSRPKLSMFKADQLPMSKGLPMRSLKVLVPWHEVQ